MTLKRFRRIMSNATPRPYACVEGEDLVPRVIGNGRCVADCDARVDQGRDDADAIVALANHADALLELWEATRHMLVDWAKGQRYGEILITSLDLDRIRNVLAKLEATG